MGEESDHPDDSTRSTHPGGVIVSDERLRRLCPDLYGLKGLSSVARRRRSEIIEHMRVGDSRAAVVVLQDPLFVAAYSDELDCVAMLRFPPKACDETLPIGARLLTVNTYLRSEDYSVDLDPGPLRRNRWQGFHPVIADFICADQAHVELRKREIADAEWERARTMGLAYLSGRPGLWRDGRPFLSDRPGQPPEPSASTSLPAPGVDGTFHGSCVACMRGTDSALAFSGPIEWYCAALVLLGVSEDGAFVMGQLAVSSGELELLDRPAASVPHYWVVARVCDACAARSPFPEPVVVRPGAGIPTVKCPDD